MFKKLSNLRERKLILPLALFFSSSSVLGLRLPGKTE